MNIVVVPSLKSELLACTSLTPTQHKGGGGMKSIVGLVASIAIPFAAPFVASSLAASMSLNFAAQGFRAIASSALVGAAMGAGVSKVMGGDVVTGALGGGFGGAIGGYNAGDMGIGSGIGVGPNVAPPIQTAGLATTPPTTDLASLESISGGSGVDTAYGGTTSAGGGGFDDLSNQLSGGDPWLNPDNTFPGTGTNRGNLSTFGDSGSTIPYTPPSSSGLNTGVRNMAGNAPADYTGFGSDYNPQTFTQKAMGFAKGLPDKILSSEGAQAAASKLLTQGVSNVAAGDTPNMTPYEEAQMAELQQARNFQKSQLEDQKMRADAYTRAANNVSPDDAGKYAAARARNTLQRGYNTVERGASAGRGEVLGRQKALDMSRTNSAYNQVRREKEGEKLRLLQQAQSMQPTGSGYASNIRSDMTDYSNKYYPRVEAETKNYADMVKPIADEIFQLDSADERERKRRAKLGGLDK